MIDLSHAMRREMTLRRILLDLYPGDASRLGLWMAAR